MNPVPARPLGGCASIVVLALIVGGLLLFALLVHGCAAPGDVHTAAILEAWKRISADGTITPEEATWFAGVLSRELATPASVNWPATIGSVVGSLLTGAIGLRVYHNQAIAPALDALRSSTSGSPADAPDATTRAT